METVVVLVTGSGQARGALPVLRRLVMRLLLLAGFTAAGWLASVLLTTGTASADLIKLPEIPGITATQPSADKPAKKDSKNNGGLVGGLLSGVNAAVGNTLASVTTTVDNTVGTVTKTVTTTVTNVTKTVTTVVDKVAEIPPAILPPAQGGGGNSLLPKPVADLLTPGSKNQDSTARGSTVETAVVAAVPAPATPAPEPAVTDASEAEHPRLLREARATQTMVHPVRVGSTQPKAAPADKNPGPVPGPSGPAAPAAPAPTASAGGNGGSDARGMLAVLTPQTLLVPPHAGRLHATDSVTDAGRSAGLPATPPD